MPFIPAAALVMLCGIALGAFGAHALRETLLAAGRVSAWETAVLYQLVHGLALFGLGVWRRCDPDVAAAGPARLAGACWIAGTLLFSGSLYLLSLGAPPWLGPVTPLGGVLFLVGWGALAWEARRRDQDRRRP